LVLGQSSITGEVTWTGINVIICTNSILLR